MCNGCHLHYDRDHRRQTAAATRRAALEAAGQLTLQITTTRTTMQKIPTLYRRDPGDRAHVLPEVAAGCEWVLAGEGVATRKYDGTCVMLDSAGDWWARREIKPGKTAPAGYQPVSTDPVTGRTVGWEPIEQSPFARFHREAVADAEDADNPEGVYPKPWPVGTYELIGPKINGNTERREAHELIAHDTAEHARWEVRGTPQRHDPVWLFSEIQFFLDTHDWEGLVWHHPDGRMAKIKARDFRNVGRAR